MVTSSIIQLDVLVIFLTLRPLLAAEGWGGRHASVHCHVVLLVERANWLKAPVNTKSALVQQSRGELWRYLLGKVDALIVVIS